MTISESEPRDSYIVATYRISSYLPLEKAAEILAGEQSSGTFTRVALESEDLKRRHGAVVSRITVDETPIAPLPGSWRPSPAATLTTGTVEVLFPTINFGPSVASLITTVAGNLYELRELAAVKLLDVELPAALAQHYSGPLRGIPGTRRLMGVDGGAMIGTIVKPSIGLHLEQLTALVRELALAGIDFIKDDELNTDPPFAPLNQRIDAVMRVLNDVADQTGKLTMYAFNVTGDVDSMKMGLERIERQGGTCAMAAIPTIGFSALAELRKSTDLALHGHRAGFGALDRHPGLGMSFRVFQKLARVCGADHLHVGGIDSKFWEDNSAVVSSVRAMQRPLEIGNPMLPVLSSAQTAATAATTHALIQSADILVLAGGGIHAHPGGASAGVSSMRAAWDAVVAGDVPEEVAEPGSPLDIALKAFGH
ncbi:ribulose-bisphosphate carboxylase large chain [Paramicrobacterium humi]|uniref:Ribulose-bisphosphate carboxylase large chain n=1 Tax=Paramicrobacterium humi TaxID=640635 RepID=A0A1H4L6B8_9MICO|nr:RuBisCO large subunit C-terminal-like domain-containing protein [Microbacterium humi]SEB66243.1 ribulose-bisphosphate carboxylase large chain [Microbacterium humi]